MTPARLAEAIARGSAPVIVDVRSRAEFARGHVPGAIHVPFWASAWGASTIPCPHDAPVVVYCGHGPRAWFSAAALRRRGFLRVSCLKGHMAEWVRVGLPQQHA